jgi:hypothetical protein
VISFLYQPYEEKGNVLLPRMLKAVKAPSIPYAKDLRENEIYVHWVKGNHKLLDDVAGGFRNEGISFINFADARVFWPLPMTQAWNSQSSQMSWECEIPEDITTALDLDRLRLAIRADVVAVYRRYVFILAACPLVNLFTDILRPGPLRGFGF